MITASVVLIEDAALFSIPNQQFRRGSLVTETE